MTRTLRSIGIAALVLTAAVGCQSMTGRTVGQNLDDTTTTAEVKTKLAGQHLSNLTRVNVDTVNGVVYLHGIAQNAADKAQATEAARRVAGVKRVVNEMEVQSAGAATGNAGQQRATSASAPSAAPAALSGEHSMTGEITDIDASKGLVTVKTPERSLDLHFPPAALQNLHKGDRVTVDLGIRPAP
jgi:BON domain-containing protein